MYKLLVCVVLMALFRAEAAPAPGLLHGALALPLATSHSSRIDIHSKPILVAAAPSFVEAPIIHAPLISAPILKSYAPVVKTIIPTAVSHSSRIDLHSAPLLSVGHGLGWGSGWNLGYGHDLWGHY